jgi:ABC-type phosphate transport system permease subunit
MLLFIALSLALPVSLCIGVLASEFPLGPLGGAMRGLLALLSGIPPVVYAVMAVVFLGPFMNPKFTGGLNGSLAEPEKIGLRPDQFPPDGLPWPMSFPYSPTGLFSTTLLAGILLALLAIPFMAPLIEDTFRNAPRDAKEASLALGATRWQTLRRITLPRALPGMVAATGLGALKVLGDVMIALFVIGYDARVPTPAWDALERTGSLTSVGVGLIGGGLGQGREPCLGQARELDCAAGYTSALILLLMALAVVLVTLSLERWLRHRYAS